MNHYCLISNSIGQSWSLKRKCFKSIGTYPDNKDYAIPMTEGHTGLYFAPIPYLLPGVYYFHAFIQTKARPNMHDCVVGVSRMIITRINNEPLLLQMQ